MSSYTMPQVVYRVTKKHLTGNLSGESTTEYTKVVFEVGERIKSIFDGGYYEITEVTPVLASTPRPQPVIARRAV